MMTISIRSQRCRLGVAGLVVAVSLAGGPAIAREVGSDCTFNGIALHGDVEIVDSFGDIKVQWVDGFPGVAD